MKSFLSCLNYWTKIIFTTLLDIFPFIANEEHFEENRYSINYSKWSKWLLPKLLKYLRSSVSIGWRIRNLTLTGKRPLVCNVCKKAFVYFNVSFIHSHRWGTARDLLKKIMVFTGKKLFVCQICNKAFAQRGTLTNHSSIHAGELFYPITTFKLNEIFFFFSKAKGHDDRTIGYLL